MKNKTIALVAIPLMMFSMAAIAKAYTEDNPLVKDLIAGQNIDVGDILIWHDDDNIYVKYVTTGSWELTETHLHVACGPKEDIPHNNKGNPIPGHFQYSTEHDPAVSEYQYTVSRSGCNLGHVHIAAHAVVTNGVQEETAWGDGCPLGGKWAMYFMYKFCEPDSCESQ